MKISTLFLIAAVAFAIAGLLPVVKGESVNIAVVLLGAVFLILRMVFKKNPN